MSELNGQLVAYNDALDAFPDWVSITLDPAVRVTGWEIRRGRTDEFQRTGTGTARIFVTDLGSVFGSTSALPVHVMINLRGTTRFRGFVKGINTSVHNSGVIESHVIECVDAFDLLSRLEVTGDADGTGDALFGSLPPDAAAFNAGDVFYEDGQVDDRIIQALFQAGWPTSMQSIFSGNVNVMESIYSPGTSTLQVISDAADAEFPTVANLFVGADGTINFRGRFARFNPDAYGIPTWHAGTESHVTSGVAQVFELEYDHGTDQVFNKAIAYPDPNRYPYRDLLIYSMYEQDTTSINKWGVRSWSAENLLTLRHNANGNTGVDECRLFAQYITENYSAPVPRITRVGFQSHLDGASVASATWDLMCNVEIGDQIEVTTDWISDTYFVEGITTTAREANGDIPYAEVFLDLSPAAFWTVDPF